MAKPILIVWLPELPKDTLINIKERKSAIVESIKNELDNEYHVLTVWDSDITEVSFKCLNDCKGLPDVDIEKLIRELMDKNETKES